VWVTMAPFNAGTGGEEAKLGSAIVDEIELDISASAKLLPRFLWQFQ